MIRLRTMMRLRTGMWFYAGALALALLGCASSVPFQLGFEKSGADQYKATRDAAAGAGIDTTINEDDLSLFEDIAAMQVPIINIEEKEETAEKQTPLETIRFANQNATQVPIKELIKNSMVIYNFYDEYIYSIYTTPQRVTVLRLDKEEELDGEMVVGDSANWIIELDIGTNRQLVYIKPILANLQTNMVINTTKRSYYLDLRSHEKTFMVAVQWRYPFRNLQKNVKEKRLLEQSLQIKELNFAYKLIGFGSDPQWKPSKVFDNGERTFIQFSSKYHAAKAPALFVLNAAGEGTLTNYRVIDDYYIVDTLFDAAELRLGTRKEDAIRIVREQ